MPSAVDIRGDPRRPVNPAMEVLGLERSEKTFIPNEKLVALLYQIRARIGYRIKLYRRLHARKYTETIQVWDDNKEAYATVTRPQVLTDEQVCATYEVCQNWIDIHDAAVKHLNSLKGFGVNAVMRNYQDRERQEERHRDSSAGTDSGQEKKWD